MSPEETLELREALKWAQNEEDMHRLSWTTRTIVEAARAYADLLENGRIEDHTDQESGPLLMHLPPGRYLVVPVEPSANQVLTDSDLAVGVPVEDDA